MNQNEIYTVKNRLAYGLVKKGTIDTWEEMENTSPLELHKYLPVFIRITPFVDFMGQILENENGKKAIADPLNLQWTKQQINHEKDTTRFPKWGLNSFDVELYGTYSALFRINMSFTIYDSKIFSDDTHGITMLSKLGNMAKIEFGRNKPDKKWEYKKPEHTFFESKIHNGNGVELLGKVTSFNVSYDDRGVGNMSVVLSSATISLMKLFKPEKLFNMNSEKAEELFDDSQYESNFTHEKAKATAGDVYNEAINSLTVNGMTSGISKSGAFFSLFKTHKNKERKNTKEVNTGISLKNLFEKILPELIQNNMKNYFLLNQINKHNSKIETGASLDTTDLNISPSMSKFVGLPSTQSDSKYTVGDIIIEKKKLKQLLEEEYQDFEALVNGILEFISKEIAGLDLTLIIHSVPSISIIVQEGNYFDETSMPTSAEKLREYQDKMLPITYGKKNNIIKSLTFDTDLQEAKNVQNYIELNSTALATPKQMLAALYMGMNNKQIDSKIFDEYVKNYGPVALIQDNLINYIYKKAKDPMAALLEFAPEKKYAEKQTTPEQMKQEIEEEIKKYLKQVWSSRVNRAGAELFPYTFSAEIFGISDLWYGSCVRIISNRIPYLDNSLWKVTDIKHAVSSTGWFTTLSGVCILHPESENRKENIKEKISEIVDI